MEIGEIKALGKAMMAREGWISRLFGYYKKVLCKVLKHFLRWLLSRRGGFQEKGFGVM